MSMTDLLTSLSSFDHIAETVNMGFTWPYPVFACYCLSAYLIGKIKAQDLLNLELASGLLTTGLKSASVNRLEMMFWINPISHS